MVWKVLPLNTKQCAKCKEVLPLTDSFFYVQRARIGHKLGWESNCRDCWKKINKLNKARIRAKS